MENLQTTPASKLNDMVDQVVTTLLPKAYLNKNYFVNDIPDHFQLGGDKHLIASILGGLLATAVTFARGSSIWLSAKIYGNVTLVHVRNSNGFNCESIESRLQVLQSLAGRTKGSIGFTSHQSTITSLTFGYSNS